MDIHFFFSFVDHGSVHMFNLLAVHSRNRLKLNAARKKKKKKKTVNLNIYQAKFSCDHSFVGRQHLALRILIFQPRIHNEFNAAAVVGRLIPAAINRFFIL